MPEPGSVNKSGMTVLGKLKTISRRSEEVKRVNSEVATEFVIHHADMRTGRTELSKERLTEGALNSDSEHSKHEKKKSVPKLKRKSKSFDFRDNMVKKSQFIPMMLNILDHYKLGKVIGKGGFSSVYMATHKELGEQRAVKVIKKIANSGIDYRKELSILMELDHPSIIKVYEVFESKDFVYIVQE